MYSLIYINKKTTSILYLSSYDKLQSDKRNFVLIPSRWIHYDVIYCQKVISESISKENIFGIIVLHKHLDTQYMLYEHIM